MHPPQVTTPPWRLGAVVRFAFLVRGREVEPPVRRRNDPRVDLDLTLAVALAAEALQFLQHRATVEPLVGVRFILEQASAPAVLRRGNADPDVAARVASRGTPDGGSVVERRHRKLAHCRGPKRIPRGRQKGAAGQLGITEHLDCGVGLARARGEQMRADRDADDRQRAEQCPPCANLQGSHRANSRLRRFQSSDFRWNSLRHCHPAATPNCEARLRAVVRPASRLRANEAYYQRRRGDEPGLACSSRQHRRSLRAAGDRCGVGLRDDARPTTKLHDNARQRPCPAACRALRPFRATLRTLPG